MHKNILLLTIAVISFMYILFFSQCVPFFFDDHEFHHNYVQTSWKELSLQFFSFNTEGGIADGLRPVYGLFFKTIFPFLGFDYCSYRIVKAIIFAVLITLIFVFTNYLLKNTLLALYYSIFIMTLFPLYIHTLVYDGPHIIAEFFKILALFLIVKDIQQQKTSFLRQFLIILFSLLAIRTYPPAYSVLGALFLFIIFYKRATILRYTFVLFAIFISQFPIFKPFSPSKGIYHFGLWSIHHVFSNHLFENLINPLPNMSNLYYKSFYDILSFFGVWFLIFILLLTAIKTFKNNHVFTQKTTTTTKINTRLLYALTLAWMLSELPTYLFLPENAIRYITTFMIPFSLFITTTTAVLLQKVKPRYHTTLSAIFIILFTGIILTNVAYTYAFRAGWGSSFMAFEGVMDFFAEHHTTATGVLYYSGAVADEYKFVNKTGMDYAFGKGITYIKSAELKEFSNDAIKRMAVKYPNFFVLKRTTSVTKTNYPPLDIENSSILSLVRVINGVDCHNTLFDRINLLMMHALNKDYQPNRVHIYKYTAEPKPRKPL